MAPQNFFDQRKEASAQKHEILQKYLRVWAYKLSSRYRQLAFVDGCAGAGSYGGGEDGSPLLAARINEDPGVIGNRARLIVHACETDAEIIPQLRAALSPYTSCCPPQAVIYEQSFVEAMPTILAATRRMPTLLFLDPYDNVTAEELAPIFADPRRLSTEILVRVDANLLARMAGWVRDKPRSARWQRTADAFRQQLPSLGLDPEAIRELLNVELPKGELMARLFEDYLALFEEWFAYVTPIPIRPAYNAAPKYYLVHCTNNVHGVAAMNDQCSTTSDSQFAQAVEQASGGQGEFFAPVRVSRVSPREAEDVVLGELQAGAHQFIHIRAALAIAFPAEFREKHHRSIVRSLLERGAIRADPAGAIEDRTVLRLAAPG